MAGSYHGTMLTPEQLITAAHKAGRPAAQRDTLYALLERYPVA
jgi:FO synthase